MDKLGAFLQLVGVITIAVALLRCMVDFERRNRD